MLTGCTIIAGNYLAFARVLASSFLRHHPDARFVVLIVDDETVDVTDEPFEVWHLGDLGVAASEVQVMAGIYTVMEFCTAVKAWLLTALCAAAPDAPVVYLDPDIEVFAPIDDVVVGAMEHGIVLTPHVLQPIPRDGLGPDEIHILSSGVFNLGFLAVGPGAISSGFLAFWAQRLRRDAIADHQRMLFTDQRWVDFVAMYPHAICRDPGYNVAYWNVWGHAVECNSEGDWTVSGRPLRFFHFSGFDPRRPHVLSRHQGDRPRVRLPDHPDLARLCRSYAQHLFEAGFAEYRARPYGWRTTRRGLALTTPMRRIYRRALLDAERSGDAAPPGPFDVDGGAAFETWLSEPSTSGGVSNLLMGRWETEAGLRALFPEPLGNQAGAFVEFATVNRGLDVARDDLYERALALPGPRDHGPLVAANPPARLHGVNLYGYFGSALSVGRTARSMSRALSAAGVSVDRRSDPAGLGPLAGDNALTATQGWSHDVNLLCVNADRTADAIARLGSHAFDRRVTAAHWAWETTMLAPDAISALELIDQVWVTSTYVADAVRRAGGGARVIDQPVEVPRWSTARTRADFGLPEGFLVLCSFDWSSVAERKNPQGVLAAYTRAFGPDDGAALVFKTMNGDRGWAGMDALRLAIGDRPDVRIIDGWVSDVDMITHLQLADCFISLHRSEGFGLLMAEAMACATPCIATAYSGNLDFMDEHTSYLVPATEIPVPDDVPVYGGLGAWGDPDIDAAADLLQQVRGDRRDAHRRGVLARERMLADRNLLTAGRSIAAAAAELRQEGPMVR